METNTNAARSSVPCAISFEHLSDTELLAGTRRLVGRSNQLLAELLAHLGEVEVRGIHRTRACSSLYAYCIYELRLSEDEAFRRVAAARLVRRFPALLDSLASGELHLTGLLLLGPHLTNANLVEVLMRAKHRTKCEISRLVRVLDPLPAVPARIEPLGPAPAREVPPVPSWEEFVQATCPVRELTPGDRPRDWMPNDWTQGADDQAPSSPDDGETVPSAAPARVGAKVPAANTAPARVGAKVLTASTAPARVGATSPEPLAPERYKVQFTATDEYVRLVEEAKALLSRAAPNLTLEDLQLRAMRALVAELSKKKYATLDQAPANDARGTRCLPREASLETQPDRAPADGVSDDCAPAAPANPRRRGRHIPAAVRRAVFERDGNQCSYVDASGKRCAETQRLEFHHVEPFAAGGEHTASNLALRCTAHNALAAEEDFGRAFMETKKASREREAPCDDSWSALWIGPTGFTELEPP